MYLGRTVPDLQGGCAILLPLPGPQMSTPRPPELQGTQLPGHLLLFQNPMWEAGSGRTYSPYDMPYGLLDCDSGEGIT